MPTNFLYTYAANYGRTDHSGDQRTDAMVDKKLKQVAREDAMTFRGLMGVLKREREQASRSRANDPMQRVLWWRRVNDCSAEVVQDGAAIVVRVPEQWKLDYRAGRGHYRGHYSYTCVPSRELWRCPLRDYWQRELYGVPHAD